MNEGITLSIAREIMGNNIIGPDELLKTQIISFKDGNQIPDIPYSRNELENKKNDYLLILGVSLLNNGKSMTIRNLKDFFGHDPEIAEPCFYNQDWYDNESFIDITMEDKWYLIRRNVYEDSRAVQPLDLLKKYTFPSAIDCTYAFFTVWRVLGQKLWYHDFVWCSDMDHNGDRIYVGKYHDIDGINKNGFSIHRHLALRPCYACID